MNVLVTGGAGFIGSHLVDRLLTDGHSVTVLDNFSTGRQENLVQHKGNKKLKVIRCDITLLYKSESNSNFQKPKSRNISNLRSSNFGIVSKFVLRASDFNELFHGIDWVFHLAARADIVPSINDPLLYHRVNVDGTLNILQAAKNAGIKRFVYAASSSCYGIPVKYPTDENAVISPQYPYALTKYIGEMYALFFGHTQGLPVVSLRLFNVYGPRSRSSSTYGAVFGVFLAQKLAGKPFTVVGNGKQTRDFTYVIDVVDAFITAAKSEISSEIFNVGTGKPVSINMLVSLLKGDVIHIPKRPGEPDCTWADISKIKRRLGWKPKVSFTQGVSEILRNINYWKDAPVWTPQTIAKATQDWFRYLKS